jgi:hypothetical protein
MSKPVEDAIRAREDAKRPTKKKSTKKAEDAE